MAATGEKREVTILSPLEFSGRKERGKIYRKPLQRTRVAGMPYNQLMTQKFSAVPALGSVMRMLTLSLSCERLREGGHDAA